MTFISDKIKTVFLITSLICISKIFCEGFVAGTVFKTIDRSVPIEAIRIGDRVYCCDAAGFCDITNVTAIRSYEASKTIQLFFENETITCAPNQLFYLKDPIEWRRAQDL